MGGCLDTLDGNPPVPFTHARWKRQIFQISLSVGPGQLQLTGQVENGALSGVVVIEDTQARLSGRRADPSEKRKNRSVSLHGRFVAFADPTGICHFCGL